MSNLTQKQLNNLHIGVAPYISKNDFDAHTTMSDIANRIAADLRFEQQLKRLQDGKLKMKKGNFNNVRK